MTDTENLDNILYPEDLNTDNKYDQLLEHAEFYRLKNVDNFRSHEEIPILAQLENKNLKLKSYQLFSESFVSPNSPYKRVLLAYGTGTGKCLGADVPVMLHDGTVKMSQMIQVGDLVMGETGEPRRVMSVCSGTEDMYKITPEFGVPFTCNYNHMLSLRHKYTGEIIDISLADYLTTISVERSGKNYSSLSSLTAYTLYLGDVAQLATPLYGFSAYKQERVRAAYELIRSCAVKMYTGVKEDVLIIDTSLSVGKAKTYSIITITPASACYLLRSIGLMCVDRGKFVYIRCNRAGLLSDVFRADPQYIYETPGCGFQISPLGVGTYYGMTLAPAEICKNAQTQDTNLQARFLLGDFIVTHNTITAISIAMNFINVYREQYQKLTLKATSRRQLYEIDKATPNVFILGFAGTKAAFIRDLLKYPEFGFITHKEREELNKLQTASLSHREEDIKVYKDALVRYKKRITNKAKGGFFRFYGYKEFVNKLMTDAAGGNVNLTDLDHKFKSALDRGETITYEEIIGSEITAGRLRINMQLLSQFDNSLMICDEIHNTYNTTSKNNYGAALQFILDSIATLRAVFMSATAINTSPEIVEVINYLVPVELKVTRKDLFTADKELLPGAVSKIGDLLMGRISFVQDLSPKYFPKRELVGNTITLPGLGEIKYLKITQCGMSELHQRTLNEYVNKARIMVPSNDIVETEPSRRIDTDEEMLTEEDDDELVVVRNTPYSYHLIPPDGITIYDMVLPNPVNPSIGIFKSSDARSLIRTEGVVMLEDMPAYDANDDVNLSNSTNMTNSSNSINTLIRSKKFSNANNVYVGDFLLEENLVKYSTKYVELLKLVRSIMATAKGIKENGAKIMIYHERVKMSGVLMIQEILKANGILDETSEPVENTLCCICARRFDEHGDDSAESNQRTKRRKASESTTQSENDNINDHQFYPARFVMAHSDLEKNVMDASLAKYNASNNANGLYFNILVGSKIIKESYDFKAIQHLIITSIPSKIPILMQIIGRAVRNYSHIDLPRDKWNVAVYMLASSVDPAYEHLEAISPELYRYFDKVKDYQQVQLIEQENYSRSVDVDINYETVSKGGFVDLGVLEYTPKHTLKKLDQSGINYNTYYAYGYAYRELLDTCAHIKRLFYLKPVYTFDELYENIQNPPYSVEVNPRLISRETFAASLHHLLHTDNDTVINYVDAITGMQGSYPWERIVDYNDKTLVIDSVEYKICKSGDYYMLFPHISVFTSPFSKIQYEYSEKGFYKSIAQANTSGNEVYADVDTWIMQAHVANTHGVMINLTNYMDNKIATFARLRTKFESHDAANYREFLEYPEWFQMNYLDAVIEDLLTSKDAKTKLPKITAALFDFLTGLDVLITAGEVKVYRDVVKSFNKFEYNTKDIIGYTSKDSVRLLDTSLMRWFETNKIALNKNIDYKDSNRVVGYFEMVGDNMKFKIRKTSVKTRQSDLRFLQKGIVCSTKKKFELLEILADLGISVRAGGYHKMQVDRICSVIKNKLIDMEMRERSKQSRIKYVYSWWDVKPKLKSDTGAASDDEQGAE
ncbi:putative ATP-dependent RNA helicase [Faustovirus]|nr:putative ATP-dependent RNA helicase [Faustovirus]